MINCIFYDQEFNKKNIRLHFVTVRNSSPLVIIVKIYHIYLLRCFILTLKEFSVLRKVHFKPARPIRRVKNRFE